MSVLAQAANDYLCLRRRLGHDLAEAHRLLPRFVEYLDETKTSTVTIASALAWAFEGGIDPASSVGSRRMTIVRGFARHLSAIDPLTEIPPHGLVPSRQRWRPPFIYTPTDIAGLLAQAATIHFPFMAATYETLFGLLAATGIRVGEARHLDHGDIDWADAVLSIRESKFGKSRLVPVTPCTLAALDRYTQLRDKTRPPTHIPAFFVSLRGNRLVYPSVHEIFRRLCTDAGIGVGSATIPRIHDLRHTFVVRTLLDWYRAGENVEVRLPALSTYLGHRDPRSTYWYLSAAPELLALAAGRLELSNGVISR